MEQLIQEIDTEGQYLSQSQKAQDLFKKKNKDYSTSWVHLRQTSHTDQIFIKAQRLRSIEEKKQQLISDKIEDEYIGIYNYSIMAILRIRMKELLVKTPKEKMEEEYLKVCKETFELMMKKNHDYGEAWRELRISTHTDLILQKIFRVKQIEDNNEILLASEGLEANYMDMANYAIFALILLSEK